MPFLALLSTLIRRRFQVKPAATLLIPVDILIFPIFMIEIQVKPVGSLENPENLDVGKSGLLIQWG